jgi:hypothetical protein
MPAPSLCANLVSKPREARDLMEIRVSGDVSAMIREANEQAEVGKVVALECGVFTKGYGSGMKPWGAFEA